MENKDKIRFKDISVILKIAIIGGLMMAAYIALIIISFIVGVIVGIFVG
ncbi:unnamed protein product [marine sediment metagenome]|uniref:Uncharacterized protein n=1 Tax=marine sediment metagenome TaxID=412755 RepID=X0Z095_9ZZZZ